MSIPRVSTQPDRDRHVLTIALTARLAGRDGPTPLTAARFWAAHSELDADLRAATSSDDAELRQLAGRTAAASLHASELERQGITLVTPFHAAYPRRYLDLLGTVAPPLLYVAGAPALLADPDRSRLAVVGSRDATDTELDAARTAAEAAVARGWDVVSGGAKGVDAVALNAAVARGGTVVALLAEGVRLSMRTGALRRLVTDGQAVLAAPVHPDAGCTVASATARNKLIYALADVTYVAAIIEGTGGTWDGAAEALRHGYANIAVTPDTTAAPVLAALGGRVATDVDELFEPEPQTRDGPDRVPPPTDGV